MSYGRTSERRRSPLGRTNYDRRHRNTDLRISDSRPHKYYDDNRRYYKQQNQDYGVNYHRRSSPRTRDSRSYRHDHRQSSRRSLSHCSSRRRRSRSYDSDLRHEKNIQKEAPSARIGSKAAFLRSRDTRRTPPKSAASSGRRYHSYVREQWNGRGRLSSREKNGKGHYSADGPSSMYRTRDRSDRGPSGGHRSRSYSRGGSGVSRDRRSPVYERRKRTRSCSRSVECPTPDLSTPGVHNENSRGCLSSRSIDHEERQPARDEPCLEDETQYSPERSNITKLPTLCGKDQSKGQLDDPSVSPVRPCNPTQTLQGGSEKKAEQSCSHPPTELEKSATETQEQSPFARNRSISQAPPEVLSVLAASDTGVEAPTHVEKLILSEKRRSERHSNAEDNSAGRPDEAISKVGQIPQGATDEVAETKAKHECAKDCSKTALDGQSAIGLENEIVKPRGVSPQCNITMVSDIEPQRVEAEASRGRQHQYKGPPSDRRNGGWLNSTKRAQHTNPHELWWHDDGQQHRGNRWIPDNRNRRYVRLLENGCEGEFRPANRQRNVTPNEIPRRQLRNVNPQRTPQGLPRFPQKGRNFHLPGGAQSRKIGISSQVPMERRLAPPGNESGKWGHDLFEQISSEPERKRRRFNLYGETLEKIED